MKINWKDSYAHKYEVFNLTLQIIILKISISVSTFCGYLVNKLKKANKNER